MHPELRRRGADVTEQRADLTAFDGTVLKAVNILGRFNTESPDRLCSLPTGTAVRGRIRIRTPTTVKKPVDGANDGASGVGVLLEIARQLSEKAPGKGVDIAFRGCRRLGHGGE